MELKPLHDRVVVRSLDAETRSPGGIVIPENAKEKPTQGEILAVGEGRTTTEGRTLPMSVKIGERVLFGQYSGQKIKVNGEEVTILREEDILAVVQ
jgi:chaperonin GroES